MLSKSAARTFFLAGTILSGLAFALLTADTLAQFDDRTNADQLTPAVKRGFEIYTKSNCMGCHTLLGEGGYYAPELTRVYDRRGPEWIKSFLQDPEAFFPGRRRMIKYDFFDLSKDPKAEQNLSDTVAFFKWVQGIDTNGFPFKPDLVAETDGPSTADNAVLVGAPPVFRSLCMGCHKLGGEGGVVGPALDGVGSRFEPDYLGRWISDPQKIKPGTTMPALGLPAQQIEELVEFLRTQK